MAGYGNKLRPRRYPIAVVKIELDPLLVDVNVHPTKQSAFVKGTRVRASVNY